MKHAGVDSNAVGTVLITHLHNDHFGGLPYLLIDAHFAVERTEPMTIAGPPGLEGRFRVTMEALFPGAMARIDRFDLRFVELAVGDHSVVDGWAVTAFRMRHGSGAPPLVRRISAGGRSFAYSGDTEWCDALPHLTRNADLFIVECSCFEWPIPGHLDHATLCARRDELTAKRILLTHLFPDTLRHADRLAFDVAADGMRLTL